MNDFAINIHDQKGDIITRISMAPRRTVEDVCAHMAAKQPVGTPQTKLGLIPHDQSLALENVLAPGTLLRPYKDVGVKLVATCTLANAVVDASLLSCRLPHIGESARRQLLERLLQCTPGQLDLASIHESPSAVSAVTAGASGIHNLVAILLISMNPPNTTTPQTSIQFEGEQMFPFRLLPDEGGVEFCSGYTCEYRLITDEHHAKQQALAAQVAHCKRLLRDLPVALENSRMTMKSHAASEEVDFNTVGAMVIEQLRIDEEIIAQGTRLKQLEEEAAVARTNPPTKKLRKYQTQMILPFGETKVGDRFYHLHAISPLVVSRTGEAVPSSIVCE